MAITLILLLLLSSGVNSFEPVTVGVVALGTWGFTTYYETIKEHTYCRFNECCSKSYIIGDYDGLLTNLKSTLFGQHFVLKEVVKALRSHDQESRNSKKPLVMVFNGTPGTGKNFVADHIAEYMYKYGVSSKYVYRFYGRQDFSEERLLSMYQKDLRNKIIKAIQLCPRSLFIFDEIDKMPSGVFDSITNLLDHNQHIDGDNYRQAVFIFLSNAGGVHIADKLANLMSYVASREDTDISDFEQVLEMSSYNENGGLKKTQMMEKSLVDLFIPFLPLERRHVEKCIQEEFRVRHKSPSMKIIQEIATKHVVYEGIFATTGCKRLSKKVGVYADGL